MQLWSLMEQWLIGMIHYNIYFEPYDWEVELYVILENCHLDDIIKSLEGSSESEIQRAFLNITTRINSGFTKTIGRKSIIVINKPLTLKEFINVYNHEKKSFRNAYLRRI